MDLLEKINRSFGSWYEGLFGGSDDVRPKDILRRILAAMEDHRKEGFDNRVYVPNQFILEIDVHDEEEKEYLLAFLDRDELEAAIRRYCQQNHYHIRGPLDFTIKEVDEPGISGKQEKVRVRCRYNTKITGPETAEKAAGAAPANGKVEDKAGEKTSGRAGLPEIPFEDRTVASVGAWGGEEGGTVPSIVAATLMVYAPDRAPFRYGMARGTVTIGRSPRSGNDLTIESDGQISKRHARIELDAAGQFTLYDLDSTNGTKVNGRRIDNRILNDGDEIQIGETRLTFQQSKPSETRGESEESDSIFPAPRLGSVGRSQGVFGGAAADLRDGGGSNASHVPPSRTLRARTARLVLLADDQDLDDFLLASETLIGRGVTNDIVLPDRSIATRHARILHDGDGYALESLSQSVTTINGIPLSLNQPTRLTNGDHIGLGGLALRFDENP